MEVTFKMSFTYWQQKFGFIKRVDKGWIIDNKSLSYLAHSRDFLNRLLSKWAFNLGLVKNKTSAKSVQREIPTFLSAMSDSGDVIQQNVSHCSSSVGNNSLRWFSSWWSILSLVIQAARKKKTESTSVGLMLWELGFLIPSHLCHCLKSFNFSQNVNSALKAKIPVRLETKHLCVFNSVRK